VLAKINDGYNAQRTQIDVGIGTVNVVKAIVEETKGAVNVVKTVTDETKGTVAQIHRHIMSGVQELTAIREVLSSIQKQNEERPCLDKGDLEMLAKRWETASAEILNAVREINPQPYLVKVPPGTVAVDIQTEEKKEIANEQV